MEKLTDFIRIYDDVISLERCAHFINLIDNGEQFVGKVTKNHIEGAVDTSVKNALDVNISEEYPRDADRIIGVLQGKLNQYSKEVGLFVPTRGTEAIFGRVYKEKEGFYHFHVDAGDAMTIDRVLSVLIYLSDVEGGDLIFPKLDYRIHPYPGRMVIFPSNWMYVHGAEMPRKGDRYLLRIFVMGSNHDIKPATMHYNRIANANT